MSSEARALGKLLAAEPVGPEQHGLPLVVEVLTEEVEFAADALARTVVPAPI